MLVTFDTFIGDKKSSMQISMRKIEDKIVFKSGKTLIFSVLQEDFRDKIYMCMSLLQQIILSKINRDGITMERLLKQDYNEVIPYYICEYNKYFLY